MYRWTSLPFFLIFAALALATLAGCVKKSLYEKAMDEFHSAAKKSDSLSQELEAVKQQTAALQADLEKTRAELAATEKRGTELQHELDGANAELARVHVVSTEEAAAANQERARLNEIIESLNSNLDETRRAVEEMRGRAEQQESRLKTFRDLAERFRRQIDAGQLDVQFVRGRMVVKLAESILFDSASTEIRPEGKAVLTEVTGVLSAIPSRNFQIEGHTDDVPIKRSKQFPSNWELSAARAAEVVRYMISQGMAPERLSAAGYGEFTPVAPNDTPENRAKNRRIEIVLMPNLDELPAVPELE